jgi:hypothetical protein
MGLGWLVRPGRNLQTLERVGRFARGGGEKWPCGQRDRTRPRRGGTGRAWGRGKPFGTVYRGSPVSRRVIIAGIVDRPRISFGCRWQRRLRSWAKVPMWRNGRRNGLKIRSRENGVWVRIPSSAPSENRFFIGKIPREHGLNSLAGCFLIKTRVNAK